MEVFTLLKLKKSRGSTLDDGPFFDLDFSPSQFKMSVSSPRHRLSSSSPFLSEEIFLNGRLFSLQSSSSEPNSMPQSTSRVRKVSKDVILRCISKLKPFYTKVSNLGFSGPSKNGFAEKQSHLKSATVLVPRRLRKSRSASSAVASVISRDDSLLQQEDGIQSAIAHCKRSFHADKAFVGAELQPMVRSMSDPGGERGGGSSADDFSVC